MAFVCNVLSQILPLKFKLNQLDKISQLDSKHLRLALV